MKEIKTKFGSLYTEYTEMGHAILSNDKKVLFYIPTRLVLHDFIHDITRQETWHDFIEYMREYTDYALMWALSLKDLKDNFHYYQVKTYGKTASAKREDNRIVKDNYVIIGEHYMLFDFTEY